MLSSGLQELDRVLGGGYPVPSAILVEGPVEARKERLLYAFLQSHPSTPSVSVFVTGSSAMEADRDARAAGVEIAEDTIWVAKEGGRFPFVIEDLPALSFLLKNLLKDHPGETVRVAFDGMSPLLMSHPHESVYKFLYQLLGEAKKYEVVVVATIEQGMHSPQILASMEQLFDGVVSINVESGGMETTSSIQVRKMKGAPVPASGARVVLDELAQRVGAASLGEKEERRLAAIMFSDMVGYSTLAQKDEALALTLVEEQKALISSVIPRFEGRIIKSLGDGFLVEFSSAIRAVKCAVEIQSRAGERNRAREEGMQMSIRIGIHVGDVVYRRGDIFGDGVNIASRVEQVSDPGGICVTQQVVDQVRNDTEVGFLALGSQELKNLVQPVELYKVTIPSDGVKPEGVIFGRRRIAVLPIVNLVPHPGDEYLADGLTEELITILSKISGVRVIARTSVLGYKGSTKKVSEIGRELKVGTVLEGSIRKSDGKVRITVKLVETLNEECLWSQDYDRELKDLFAVQTDVAESVAEALQVRLLASERQVLGKAATESVDAYTSYMKGRYHWSKRTIPEFREAILHFEAAVSLDPSYALAYAGLADCYNMLGYFFIIPPRDAFAKSKEALAHAIEINEGDAETHTSLGFVALFHDWDWPAAFKEFERALVLNPNYATARQWYAMALVTSGQVEGALAQITRAKEIDPLSPVMTATSGLVRYFSRSYDHAVEDYVKAIRMDPNYVMAHSFLGLTYIQMARFDEGIGELEKAATLSSRSTFSLGWLCGSYAAAGRIGEARALIEELMSRPVRPNPSIGAAYAAMSDMDKAFEWLEKAYKERSCPLAFIKVYPVFDSLRADPRFDSLLRRLGLTSERIDSFTAVAERGDRREARTP